MTEQSRTVMARYQVRKTGKQKEAFRRWLCGELERAGYAPTVEAGNFSKNVVAGDPERARVIFTAHYDTQPALPFPNFITPRNLFIYILFNLAICLGLFAAVLLVQLALLMLSAPIWAFGWASTAVCLVFLWWLFFGPANRHTANDNTSGVLTLLETALALPPEDRDSVCFVFFDNEEKGMLGSSAFASRHRAAGKNTLNLNFDCVSDGDYIQFFPSRKLKKDGAAIGRLESAFRGRGAKSVEVVRSFGFYPSDNASFRRSAGVCALHRGRAVGYYMSRIHTARDTVLEEENILLLRDGALAYAHGLEGGEKGRPSGGDNSDFTGEIIHGKPDLYQRRTGKQPEEH